MAMESLKLGIINNYPFIVSSNNKSCPDICGMVAELWKYIAKSTNISYTVGYETFDDYGFLQENGSWNGMIGMVERNEIDVVLALFIPNYARSKIGIFSAGHYFIPSLILTGRTDGTFSLSFQSLLNLETEMYFIIPLTLVIVSLVVYFGCIPRTKINSFPKIIWRIVPTLFGQGMELGQMSLRSNQMFAIIFWLIGVFLIIAQVCGYLNATLSGRVVKPVDSIGDIIKNSKLVPILTDRGFYKNFFKFSEDETYKEIWWLSQTRANLGKNLQQAIQEIIEGKGALIDVSTDLFDFVRTYYEGAAQHLYLGKELFLWSSNVFLMSKNIPAHIVQEINNRIVQFAVGLHYTTVERLVARDIDRYFWHGEKTIASARSVSVEDIIPVTSVWIFGIFLSTLSMLFEKVFHWK